MDKKQEKETRNSIADWLDIQAENIAKACETKDIHLMPDIRIPGHVSFNDLITVLKKIAKENRL